MNMSYIYRRLFTGDSPETISECFADLYNSQFGQERYVALRCRAWALGRPLPSGKRLRRWYESKEDPDQLWLPFEEFIPAKVTMIDTMGTMGMGSGYTVECCLENGSRYRGLYYLNRPNSGPDSILAMETYKRVHVRTPEESVGPFQTLSRNLSEATRSFQRIHRACFVSAAELGRAAQCLGHAFRDSERTFRIVGSNMGTSCDRNRSR
jgi:hypothetical protein